MLDSIYRIIKSNSRLGAIFSIALLVVLMVLEYIFVGMLFIFNIPIVLALLGVLVFTFAANDKLAKYCSIAFFIFSAISLTFYSVMSIVHGRFPGYFPSIGYLVYAVLFIIFILLFLTTHVFKMVNAQPVIPLLLIGLSFVLFVFNVIYYFTGYYKISFHNIVLSLADVFTPIAVLFSYIHSFCNK